jgi:hypothetical protein
MRSFPGLAASLIEKENIMLNIKFALAWVAKKKRLSKIKPPTTNGALIMNKHG